MRYRLSEIATICRGELLGEDLFVDRVSTDSRNSDAGEGVIFVAIKGQNHDSHRFVESMYRRGVRAFMLEQKIQLPEGCSGVVVDSSIIALQALAAHYRSRFSGRVVAIAGSNGKTMVKEWLSQALPSSLSLFRSPKSYNSQLGVALSLLMARGDEDIWLIEAGISKMGEMERLEQMIRPDVAVFTSLGEAHQENFDSLEQKALQKLKLALRAKTIIYHSDYQLYGKCIKELYGNDEKRVVDASLFPLLRNENKALETLVGQINGRIVVASAQELGYDADLERVEPMSMRLELKEGLNGSIIIDDVYNSDINSLKIALDYLVNVANGRATTLILSDIEQSGQSPDELYGEVSRLIRQAGIDRFMGIGPNLKAASSLFDERASFYSSTEELIASLHSDHYKGRAVLVKGSRLSRLERVVHSLEQRTHTTTLEINLDDMVHNLNYFRSKLGKGVKLTAMVKAASYGNGDFEVAQMLQYQGVDYLAVAFADEGVLLRERGITMPIVVLNADEGSFEQMIRHRLEPEIYNFRSLRNFESALHRTLERDYPIHIKLDTGMHRLGFVEQDIDALIDILGESSLLRVASVFTHLNCSDMPDEDDYTRQQVARFDAISSRIASSLLYPLLRHCANSAAIDRSPEAQFDMCRLGLGLYGFGYEHNPQLRPVSTLRTRIVQIKSLKAGDAVGYGRAGKLERDTVSATIPIGYADGLDRHLGCGRWSMLVAGQKAPILGRVCMDSCMIDVTDIEGVKEGDEVIVFSPLLGNDPESMARQLDTIPYEIMTSISSRVKRIYTKE